MRDPLDLLRGPSTGVKSERGVDSLGDKKDFCPCLGSRRDSSGSCSKPRSEERGRVITFGVRVATGTRFLRAQVPDR